MATQVPAVAPQAAMAGRVAARYAGLTALAFGLAALHLRHRPATFCPFRELTGIPCPFCGGTTAAVRLGHGHLRGALAASPLAVGMLAVLPWVGSFRPPAWWVRSRRTRWTVIGTALAVSEVFELFRFGIISWH